jgi:hypothetical protein
MKEHWSSWYAHFLALVRSCLRLSIFYLRAHRPEVNGAFLRANPAEPPGSLRSGPFVHLSMPSFHCMSQEPFSSTHVGRRFDFFLVRFYLLKLTKRVEFVRQISYVPGGGGIPGFASLGLRMPSTFISCHCGWSFVYLHLSSCNGNELLVSATMARLTGHMRYSNSSSQTIHPIFGFGMNRFKVAGCYSKKS